MSFEREPIFHDRQFVLNQVLQNTASASFVDIVNATVTTKDLGQEGNYVFSFSFIVSASVANTIASFRLTINGTPVTSMPRTISLKAVNADVGITFTGIATQIVSGDILEAQWSTDKGTITMPEFNFLIDGIPDIRVIQ